jgi:hypothetical protein
MLLLDVALALDADTEYQQGSGKLPSKLPYPPMLVVDDNLRISPRSTLHPDEQLAVAEKFLAEVTTWVQAVREYVAEVQS